LLFEGFRSFPEQPDVEADFGFVSEVPDSTPPRHGRTVDTVRGWLAVLILLGVIVLSSLKVADLVLLAIAGGFICIVFNIVHRDSVLDYLNVPLYLLIGGGVGIGEAFSDSGLANALAEVVLSVAQGSQFAVLVALAAVAMLLTNLMSSAAVAALLAPLGNELCQKQGLSFRVVALLFIFSANAAFCTPFATPMNAVIQGLGRYTFGDYCRYGMPLQVLHLIAAPALCFLFAETSAAGGPAPQNPTAAAAAVAATALTGRSLIV